MKRMSCRQLGGACDEMFEADSFEQIAELSQQHGMAMFERQDAEHLAAMQLMRERMKDPSAMAEWFEAKRREFDALPDDS